MEHPADQNIEYRAASGLLLGQDPAEHQHTLDLTATGDDDSSTTLQVNMPHYELNTVKKLLRTVLDHPNPLRQQY
jgi:hypothetical protein